ncbi:DUF2591 family protein [Morganella morganii]|uniref:DUF2591 family protein n=1 Tax=Morganella morganii TaxID=582 RepID=UPI000D1F4687|nr:DUF2591 family protein [Morganella morganii]QXO44165.1 DUF2591 family protein [Morganella morganii]QXO47757.1 DUF2591 family protein [Morganella morganii]QXO51548.1 DUF2591 family protein [Morganella morganii]QXO55411.1 DUF2591 family protein [Morganella morganii]QXO82010.1 DUF2591 family protein [Morganella morganii]
MNKYRDKSDFEINCQVLATFEPDIEHMCLSHDKKSFYHCGFDGNGFYETTIPDYCNNPADAMPIFIDNKMGVIFLGDLVQISDFSGGTVNFGKNFYRTIAELFLMMKDAENEKS